MGKDKQQIKYKTKQSDNYKRRLKRNNDESSDSEDSYTSCSEEDEINTHEYRKFLSKIFPSKHINKQIKDGERLKKHCKKREYSDEDYSSSSYSKPTKPKYKNKAKNNRKNKKRIVETESESEWVETSESEDSSYEDDDEDEDDEDEDDEDEDDEDDEDDDEDDDDEDNPKKNNFNIVFTIDDRNDGYDSSSGDNNSKDTENEDEPLSISSSEDENNKKKSKRIARKKMKHKKQSKTPSEDPVDTKIIDILKTLKSNDENKDSKLVDECIELCENKMKGNKKKQDKLTKLYKERNSRIFKRISRDKNTMDDFKFFGDLEVDGQKQMIKELREVNKATRIEKPYRLTVLESDIPVTFKSIAMKKINSLRNMDPENGEYHKIHNWVNAFMRIPFGTYKSLPINISDGVEKCHDFMENAKTLLDEAVYGLNDAKMQIMQLLGQFVTNPNAIGSAIAIHGPPGTGKTSLVREGISKILNRPFAFIALGGATDSTFLEGHGYTYEGSTWGKIVQILIDSKCMNPVIYFDELDKISDTPKGEEIAGILTHLTDSSQNSQFHDKYFSEIDFDLSKCLFIFSYNDETKINPILRDRMYRIQTMGYTQKQKSTISNHYLLPKIREQVKFEENDIIIPDSTISYIIENFCNNEDGVRNLKRCLEIIYTKINLFRLMKPGSNLFEEDMTLTVDFPFTVTTDIITKLIKNKSGLSKSLYGLYC